MKNFITITVSSVRANGIQVNVRSTYLRSIEKVSSACQSKKNTQRETIKRK
jgi:hypothetical protein